MVRVRARARALSLYLCIMYCFTFAHLPTTLFQAALLTAPSNLTVVFWNVYCNGNGNGWHAGLSEVELRRGSLCLCHLLLLSTYLLEAPGRLD